MDHAHEVAAFRAVLQALGKRPSTVYHYTAVAQRFLRWLGDGRDSVRRISAADARAFLLHLASTTTMASATYNIAFNALRHFLVQCVGIAQPDLGLKPQRRARPPRRVLAPESVAAILGQVRSTRYRTVLAVMYGLGLRLNEVCHLQLCDVEKGTGMIVITHTKGGDARRVPASPMVLKLLRQHWRTWRPTTWIFTRDGRPDSGPITGDTVQHHLREAIRASGLAVKGSTHLLRHSFACHQVANGCDLRSLQAALGHANLNTTLTYLGDLDALQGHRPAVMDLLATLPGITELLGGAP